MGPTSTVHGFVAKGDQAKSFTSARGCSALLPRRTQLCTMNFLPPTKGIYVKIFTPYPTGVSCLSAQLATGYRTSWDLPTTKPLIPVCTSQDYQIANLPPTQFDCVIFVPAKNFGTTSKSHGCVQFLCIFPIDPKRHSTNSNDNPENLTDSGSDSRNFTNFKR